MPPIPRPPFVTRINEALMPALPRTAVFAQRVYMKVNGMVWSRRKVLTLFGATMEGDTGDFIFKRICLFGLWEPNLTRFISSKVTEGQTVVGVGANIGYFTLLMANNRGFTGNL
jgi:hypothetical protein